MACGWLVQAVLVGSIRPGLTDRNGLLPLRCTVTARAWPSPPGRSTKPSPRSVRNRKTWRMLPPGCAAVRAVAGSILRAEYAGPPAAVIAATSLATVTSEATVPSSVAPLLSWISSSATRSGAARLCTICPASRSYLVCGSAGCEVLDVEGGHGQLAGRSRSLVTSRWIPPEVDRRGGGQHQEEVAEVVVQHADRGAGERVAHVGDRPGAGRQQDVVGDQPGRVGVVVAGVDDAAARRLHDLLGVARG